LSSIQHGQLAGLVAAVLDDRGLQGPDRHPEHQLAKPDWEGVASGVVFAQ